MAERGLTAKQERFIEEYIIDLNATQAAIRAGYSERTAGSIGNENLQKPEIRSRIDQAIEERSIRTRITQDDVLLELARVAFAKMADYIEWDNERITIRDSKSLNDDKLAAVLEINESFGEHGRSLRIKLADKLGALRDLGKHFGLFVDRREVSGPGGERQEIKWIIEGVEVGDDL